VEEQAEDRQDVADDVRELRAMLADAQTRVDLLMTARRRQLAAARSRQGGSS
jgi:hypothetical protein